MNFYDKNITVSEECECPGQISIFDLLEGIN